MKRGSISKETFFAFEIILGILVAGIFIYTATHINEFSNVDVIYAESDLDLLASTILASPGEISYNYELSGKMQATSGPPFDIQKDLTASGSPHNLTISKEAHSKTPEVIA